MIVSHRHKFIFMKTRKTGGTSVELALSTICGPDDVITRIGKDERSREGVGARNYEPDRRQLPLLTRLRLAFGAKPERIGAVFRNHMPAARARALLGAACWDDYFKFSIERNPWDRQVSYYFYLHRDPETRPDFETYLSDPRYRARIDNFSIYALGDKIAVDRVLRYETLADDFAGAMATLGVSEPPALPHAKGRSRPEEADYRAYYTAMTRDIVAGWYAREIEAFGYRFDPGHGQ